MLNPCFSPNLPLWNVADLADLHKHMEKQQQVSNMGNLCTAFELCASWPILALGKSFSSSSTARGHPLCLLELQITPCHCWWGQPLRSGLCSHTRFHYHLRHIGKSVPLFS